MITKNKERLYPLFVTRDELLLLRDRVASGPEAVEDDREHDLLKKIWGLEQRDEKYDREAQRRPPGMSPRERGVAELVGRFWPPGYHSTREVYEAILAYVDTCIEDPSGGALHGSEMATRPASTMDSPTIITSDDGPDEPCLSIAVDEQGDVYVGTKLQGERRAQHVTRLCGPGGGCRMVYTRLAVLLLDAVTRNHRADIVRIAAVLLRAKNVELDVKRALDLEREITTGTLSLDPDVPPGWRVYEENAGTEESYWEVARADDDVGGTDFKTRDAAVVDARGHYAVESRQAVEGFAELLGTFLTSNEGYEEYRRNPDADLACWARRVAADFASGKRQFSEMTKTLAAAAREGRKGAQP